MNNIYYMQGKYLESFSIMYLKGADSRNSRKKQVEHY